MKPLSALYARAIQLAGHPRAKWYLAALAFAEGWISPVPPDVILAPMSLAKPRAAWGYAWLVTFAVTCGGVLGYLIGGLALHAVKPWLMTLGYWAFYLRGEEWFRQWGVWAIVVAAFSPVPYKLFAIAAGAAAMPLLPFMLASALGRGCRFFLVAALTRWGGKAIDGVLRQHIDRSPWR